MIPDIVVIALAFGVLAALANLAELRPQLRVLLYAMLCAANLLLIVYVMQLVSSGRHSPQAITVVSGIAVATALLSTLCLLTPFRQILAPIFPARSNDPQSGLQVGYDPFSMTQMTGLIFCLYLVANTFINFALAGGISGLAENVSITANSLVVETLLLVTFAVIGVGLGFRRTLSATLRRLGLRAPTLVELFNGAGMAIILFGMQFVFSVFWQQLVPPDVIQQQSAASQAISNRITTLMFGFLLAASAAIGEEVAFRGALQPTFGLLPTSVIFAILHTQYTFTPASAVIFFVGLGFGWLRQRFNTTTAIVAHFLYNFGSVTLLVLGRYWLDSIGRGL